MLHGFELPEAGAAAASPPALVATSVLDMREGTILRSGNWDDWLAVDSLRKKEGTALGFIPQNVYESILTRSRVSNRDRWKTFDLLITEDNADFTGFCLVGYANPWAHIFQIVVRPDARRWHRALLMVDWVEQKARRLQKAGLTCRVAVDLESNLFWTGVGFHVAGTQVSTWLNQTESKSKRPLHVYRKPLAQGVLL